MWPRRAPYNKRCLAPDRRVDCGQHLLGHQDLRAAAALAVEPILAGIEQRPELADLLAESQDLVDDLVGRSGDDEAVANRIDRQLGVRLITAHLEHFGAAAAFELGQEL